MKKTIAAWMTAAACLFSGYAAASEGGAPWDKFPQERITDMAALQHGAKLFVNYCLNCHSASYMRYNRMRDIGLSEVQIKENLLFASEKVGEPMQVSMNPKNAKEWFGAVPPDLSVITRSRSGPQGSGADYVYTYLRSYYRDDTRPTGWNNTAFPNVGMPHVLWELQGQQRVLTEERKDPHDPAHTAHVVKGFELVSPGQLSPNEYKLAVADLVAYLQWMGEPAQNQRLRLGVWVLLFLGLLTLVIWRLNAAYWKQVQ
jgi:ubiquinol-cytochrome c reductase cytochrome c1 subunit